MDPLTVGAGAVAVFLTAVVGLFKLVFTEMRVQRQEARAAADEQLKAAALAAKEQREAFEATMNNHVSQTAKAMNNVADSLAELTKEVRRGQAAN